MGRRSSGGRSSRTPTRNPLQPATPTPPPATAQGGTGSVMGTMVSSLVDGIGWGAGVTFANRFMDFVVGPRALRVENVTPTSGAPTTKATNSVGDADACGTQSKAFQDCLNSSGSDIGKCQFYMDMLSECRSSSVIV